jgi:hypothetical protein
VSCEGDVLVANFSMLCFGLVLLFLAVGEAKPRKSHKKPPQSPPLISKPENDDFSIFDYCGEHNFTTGQQCGDQAGLSFCVADIDGTPACVVSVWCFNLHQSCSDNSECPHDICANTCGNGYQCNPLCGNEQLPYGPLHDDVPYYADSYRCYDETDSPNSVIPFFDAEEGIEERSYTVYLQQLQRSSTTSSTNRPSPYSRLIVLTLTVVITVFGIISLRHFVAASSTPNDQTHHFQELSSSDHTLTSVIIELEPSLHRMTQEEIL